MVEEIQLEFRKVEFVRCNREITKKTQGVNFSLEMDAAWPIKSLELDLLANQNELDSCSLFEWFSIILEIQQQQQQSMRQ